MKTQLKTISSLELIQFTKKVRKTNLQKTNLEVKYLPQNATSDCRLEWSEMDYYKL